MPELTAAAGTSTSKAPARAASQFAPARTPRRWRLGRNAPQAACQRNRLTTPPSSLQAAEHRHRPKLMHLDAIPRISRLSDCRQPPGAESEVF